MKSHVFSDVAYFKSVSVGIAIQRQRSCLEPRPLRGPRREGPSAAREQLSAALGSWRAKAQGTRRLAARDVLAEEALLKLGFSCLVKGGKNANKTCMQASVLHIVRGSGILLPMKMFRIFLCSEL